jgi:hypothetical protein
MTMLHTADGPPWPCHNLAMPIAIGDVHGTTRNVGVDSVVFLSPVSFAVGSEISFVISTPADFRFQCSAVVTEDRESPSGGFQTAASIQSIRIVPLET